MGKIYCVMGKSSSGKDSIYHRIMSDQQISLHTIIPYTTRPMREGEVEGREYHFVGEDEVKALRQQNKIIELRTYQTVYGPWHYFTVNDGNIDLEHESYLYIVTLEGYCKIRDYYGSKAVVPIYIEVEDGQRLLRAIAREQQQVHPQYEEMCRRFLADSQDFSEEHLAEAQIEKRFQNDSLELTTQRVIAYILSDMEYQL